MKRTHHPLRPQSGFTLVELLVAIAIIGILMGIAIPAISGALRKGRESAIRSEVESLSQAIEAYKLKYGDYPPDFSNWGLVVRHYRKIFPNIAPSELMILQSCCAVKAEADSTSITSPAHDPDRIDRAEALVWSLGGFSSDPQQPFTGAGGPLQPKPTFPNSRTQHYSNYAYNSSRDNALFDFDANRLTIGGYNELFTETGTAAFQYSAYSTEEPDQSTLTSTSEGQNFVDIFPVFLRDKDHSPYIYFDSRTYLTGAPANRYRPPNDNPWGAARPYLSDQSLEPSQAVVTTTGGTNLGFVNPNTFQIIHGGLDDIFCVILDNPADTTQPVYFSYPSGQAYIVSVTGAAPYTATPYLGTRYQETSESSIGSPNDYNLDNMTNFAESALGNQLPERLIKMLRRNVRANPAFTLVEILVVVALMGILAGMMAYAMAGASQEAREKRAKAEIEAMNSIILQQLNEIYLRPVAFTTRQMVAGPQAIAAGDELQHGIEHNRIIMLARRDLARMILPQCRADLIYPPARLQCRRRPQAGQAIGIAVKVKEPNEWGLMRRTAGFAFPSGATVERSTPPTGFGGFGIASNFKLFEDPAVDPLYGSTGYFSYEALRKRLGAMLNREGNSAWIDVQTQHTDWTNGDLEEDLLETPWTREHESAECLYLILASTMINGERALDQFGSRMIANIDGDAVPEIVDPWGVPYEFIRDATGFGAPYSTTTITSHPAGADGNDFLRTDFRYQRLTPTNPLDDPYRIVPQIISAGSDGDFGIRRSFNKAGSVSAGTAGISPAQSVSAVRLSGSTGANLPQPAANSYQYPDPYLSFLPTDDPTSPVSLGNLSSYTSRTWTGAALGLGAVIDATAATDNIFSSRGLEGIR